MHEEPTKKIQCYLIFRQFQNAIQICESIQNFIMSSFQVKSQINKCSYSYIKMGQLITNDRSKQLFIQAPPCNVTEKITYSRLLVCKCLEAPYYQKIFHYENYKKLEVTYKFLPDTFIHLELIKEKAKQEEGSQFSLGNEVVYGYKFKKNQKTDKIRPDKIFFRRKIYSSAYNPAASRQPDKLKNSLRNRSRRRDEEFNRRRESRYKHIKKQQTQRFSDQQSKEELIRKLAELKLLGKLEFGARMARINGFDGILTEHYIQFYSQIPIEKGELEKKEVVEKQKLLQNVKSKGFKVSENILQMAYSVFQKGYILKQSKPLRVLQDQVIEGRSIKYMVKIFQEQINALVCKLDVITNMATSIQNYLSFRDADKAMQKFQEVMAVLDQNERLVYAQKMAQMLGKNNFYRPYQKEVSSYISSSRSSLAQSRNLSSSRFGDKRARSPQSQNESHESFSGSRRNSKNSLEHESRIPFSPVTTSPKSTTPLQYSQCQSPRISNNSDRQISSNEWQNQRFLMSKDSEYQMWQAAVERLKTSINESDKEGIAQSLTCLKNLAVLNPTQIEAEYGRLLMENGKTKYAKSIFERILYLKKNSKEAFVCSQIESMLAFLCFQKHDFPAAFYHYEKALTQRFKFRNYSRKTAIIFNNMSVIQYFLGRLQKSLLYLHRGFRLGEYCPDYELVMRNNYAMILAEKGKLRQAKMQLYKTFKNIQPYSNMQILNKFHNNLGYFQMAQAVHEKDREKIGKAYEKAKLNFDSALQIQTKYLIPNGYKPSIFLYNNLAIYHTKIPNKHNIIDWKKAASFLYKIQNQLNQLQGITAVQIHFNFGKILKNDFKKLDEAEHHFFESKNKLLKLKQALITLYLDKINAQIDKIQTQRIEEESEESSYANKWSKVSKRSLLSNKSHKQIDSKIIN